MTLPPSVTPTGSELAALRTCLHSFAEQAEALRGRHDAAKVAVQLAMVVAGARFLLQRSEETLGRALR